MIVVMISRRAVSGSVMVTMVLFWLGPREVLGIVSALGVGLLASRNRGSGGLGGVIHPLVGTR